MYDIADKVDFSVFPGLQVRVPARVPGVAVRVPACVPGVAVRASVCVSSCAPAHQLPACHSTACYCTACRCTAPSTPPQHCPAPCPVCDSLPPATRRALLHYLGPRASRHQAAFNLRATEGRPREGTGPPTHPALPPRAGRPPQPHHLWPGVRAEAGPGPGVQGLPDASAQQQQGGPLARARVRGLRARCPCRPLSGAARSWATGKPAHSPSCLPPLTASGVTVVPPAGASQGHAGQGLLPGSGYVQQCSVISSCKHHEVIALCRRWPRPCWPRATTW